MLKELTWSNLLVATPQTVSSKYASDLWGFDNTSHAWFIILTKNILLSPNNNNNKLNPN